MNKIIKLNDKLNNMNYDLMNDNIYKLGLKKYVKTNDKIKLYYVLKPKEFIKYNGGNCSDYCNYIAYYFDKKLPNIKYKLLFYTIKNFSYLNPYHCMFIFKYNNKYYYMENSLRIDNNKYIGLYKFNTLNECIKYIIKIQRKLIKKYYNSYYNSNNFKDYLIEYTNDYKKIYHMNFKKLFNFMKLKKDNNLININ